MRGQLTSTPLSSSFGGSEEGECPMTKSLKYCFYRNLADNAAAVSYSVHPQGKQKVGGANQTLRRAVESMKTRLTNWAILEECG